jgi:hypothetical protein
MVRRNFKIGAIDAANVNVTANGFAATLTANADLSSNVSFSLPGTEGTSGQVLSTDGSGNLFFADSSGNTKAYVGDTFVSNTAVILEAGEGTSIQANADTNVISFSTAMSNITSQTLSVDGSANTFTLAKSVSNSHMVLVSYNGLLQTPAQYEVDDTSLTISNTKPLLADSFIEVRYFDFFGFPGIVSGGGGGGAPAGWAVDVSQISYDSVSLDVSGQLVNARDVCFSADGTKMYTICTLFDAVFQYSLSTAFDLSTASYDSVSFTLTGGVANPQSIAFNSDGTKMYALDRAANEVFQYSLSTAFDISTTSYDSVSFSVASQTTYNQDLFFSTDGTKMYVVSMFSPSEIFQYSLSTAFDISTASYNSVSFDATGEPQQLSAVTLNPDGTKMYVVYQGASSITGSIRSYSLSTAFDISTASYDNATKSISTGTAGYPYGMHFSYDGTKMFILTENEEYVYQYSTGL